MNSFFVMCLLLIEVLVIVFWLAIALYCKSQRNFVDVWIDFGAFFRYMDAYALISLFYRTMSCYFHDYFDLFFVEFTDASIDPQTSKSLNIESDISQNKVNALFDNEIRNLLYNY